MALRVLSIPADHPYPRALKPEGGWVDITVLPDPVIDQQNPGRWWPHPAFTPGWWEHRDSHSHTGVQDGYHHIDIDLVHVHFGFEHLTPQETKGFTDTLQRKQIPLILTVHDLDNPHLEDQGNYHEQLRILIQAAAHLFTLSEEASRRVEKLYGRRPEVTSHPVIVANPGPVAGQTDSGRAGVFLKSVRANVVTEPQFYRDLNAEVYIHEGANEQLQTLADHIHSPMDDRTLFKAIASHAVVVLPYQRGTHSGWMRMCRDLGVSVAVPDCGCYASQMDGDPGVATYRTGDGKDAARAVRELLRTHPVPPLPVPDAVAQHHQVYVTVASET